MEILFIWLGLSFVVGLIGQNKDLGCAGAFFISLLLSPLIGLIAVAVSSSKKKEEPPKAPNASSQTQVEMETENPEKKECPYCGFEDESGSQFCPGCERDAKGNTKEHYKRMAEDPEYKRRVQEEEEKKREEERKEQERIKDEEERELRRKQEEEKKKKKEKKKRDWILLVSIVGGIALFIFIGRQFSGDKEEDSDTSFSTEIQKNKTGRSGGNSSPSSEASKKEKLKAIHVDSAEKLIEKDKPKKAHSLLIEKLGDPGRSDKVYEKALELKSKADSLIRVSEKKKNKELRKALKELRKSRDDVEGVTWYKNPYFTHHNNTNRISIYIGEKDNGKEWLRLKMSYAGSNWIFFEEAFLSYEGNTIKVPFDDYENKKTENRGGQVWEWIDVSVSSKQKEFLKDLANSSDAKMKLSGKYGKTRSLTYNERKGIQTVLKGYKALEEDI